uniref:Uncharacterized protein n=1 Tax=Zea mays TaxID=4577 RepID=A0A804PAS1_MAIZE
MGSRGGRGSPDGAPHEPPGLPTSFSPHHCEVSGALQTALLHMPRKDEVLYTIVPASETGGPSGAAKAEGRGTGERELGSQVKVPDRTKPAREGEAGEGAHVVVHG